MKTPNGHSLPDFIIIGAMKSGTTSIHHILASRNDVYIPEKEIYFFDVDDREQHADFFIEPHGRPIEHDLDKDFDLYLDWYRRFFTRARSDQMIGEDTTTYLASRKAPERIAKLLPDVKLIAVLRDPVDRAYSHYWHNLAAGRMTTSFDAAVRTQGGNLIARGFYAEQIRRYDRFLGQGRLKVVLFEDFVKDKQGTTDAICRYLGLEGSVDLAGVDTHRNPATVPRNVPLRLLLNRVYRVVGANRSNRNIPHMPAYDPERVGDFATGRPLTSRLWDLYRNRLPSRKYPPMETGTRAYLEDIYRRENAGLSKLIDRDVSERWSYMKGA